MKEHVTEFFASKKTADDDQMMMEGKEAEDEIEEELVKIKRHIDQEQADNERVDAIRQLWDMVRDSQSHAIHKRSVGKQLALKPPGFQATWKKLRRDSLLKKDKMAKKAKNLFFKKF